MVCPSGSSVQCHGYPSHQYSTQMAESIYGNDYLLERLQLWVDNLNLLYVAFTVPERI